MEKWEEAEKRVWDEDKERKQAVEFTADYKARRQQFDVALTAWERMLNTEPFAAFHSERGHQLREAVFKAAGFTGSLGDPETETKKL